MEFHFPRTDLVFAKRSQFISIGSGRSRISQSVAAFAYSFGVCSIVLLPIWAAVVAILRIFFDGIPMSSQHHTGLSLAISLATAGAAALFALSYAGALVVLNAQDRNETIEALRITEQAFLAEIDELIEHDVEPAVSASSVAT
jgi:hypothetical protein